MNESVYSVYERFRTGLVFVLRLNTIFGFKYWASTRPRLQAFKICFENESRVGTPIRRWFTPKVDTEHIRFVQTNEIKKRQFHKQFVNFILNKNFDKH